ncbi:signal transduction protein [Levilactobacillus koreensis JCM 16448]|uniref:Signal transduction protein n=1 Tax=Levilactobacillus koreensis TaxID=637971 RepID=A0AAC8UUF3_9LACO|nr:GHKL domain-containing protein [Levilactobacillus koreensis]AKP64671.1 signal transduction protein [Levilactobacillus koreensis]KRK90787.1 signal transduction protein [Levilactobacillus koreensis JCM 16448]
MVHVFDQNFWINFVLAMTMQWFLTLWIGLIRPQNWKLPLKWMGWALIPAFIGRPWALMLPPLSALLYLIHHRRKMALIFVNATIVIYLVVVLVNDLVRQVMIELWGLPFIQLPWVMVARLSFQIAIYSLISLAVSGMRIQPGNLERLAFSRKEQWTVTALMGSLAVLAQFSTIVIHKLDITHAMLTFALSIELVMILLISASLFIFLQSFFHRQRLRALYQESRIRSRYDRRISDQVQAIRQFKQLYQRQMLQLGVYLDQKDYAGLTAYYQTLSERWQATSQLAGLEEEGLQRLGDPPLKSLLFQKILAAQNQGVSLRLEIPDRVQSIPMDSMQLLRIMGILLDNALEASPVGADTEIHCAVLDYPDAVELSVANPVSPDRPPQINRFMAAGYTTKGGSHGLGLSTVHDIVSQTKNAALQIELKRNMLYFTIILTKPGRSSE